MSLAGDSLQFPGPSHRAHLPVHGTPGRAPHVGLMRGEAGPGGSFPQPGEGFAQPQETCLEVGTSLSECGNEPWQDTSTAHSTELPATRPGSGWHLQLWPLSGGYGAVHVAGFAVPLLHPARGALPTASARKAPVAERGAVGGPGQLGTNDLTLNPSKVICTTPPASLWAQQTCLGARGWDPHGPRAARLRRRLHGCPLMCGHLRAQSTGAGGPPAVVKPVPVQAQYS